MLAPQRIAAGAVLRSGPEAPITVGNTLPLAAMPAGTQVRRRRRTSSESVDLLHRLCCLCAVGREWAMQDNCEPNPAARKLRFLELTLLWVEPHLPG